MLFPHSTYQIHIDSKRIDLISYKVHRRYITYDTNEFFIVYVDVTATHQFVYIPKLDTNFN